MKYETMLPVAAVLALALAAGCERRDDTTGATRTTSATPSEMDDMVRDASVRATGTTAAMRDTAGADDTTATTSAMVEPPLDEHDKAFIMDALSGSMGEIALGTTASMKAAHPDVKSFADRMVNEHGKAADELRALAAKKGVAAPGEMEKASKIERDKLSKLTGAKLDKEYADYVMKDEDHDLKAFQKAAKEAKDPDVKAWAAKMVPALEDQRKAAKQLDAKIKR